MERGDLCSACFDERNPELDLIFWRTVHQENAKQAVKMDFEVLYSLLVKLRKDRRPPCRDFCFLLALLMVRHRRLRLMSVTRKRKKEYLVLRKVRTQKIVEVEVRDLSPELRQRLSRVLSELLDPTRDGDLDGLLKELNAPIQEKASADQADALEGDPSSIAGK